jgi:hypothetical protein
MKQEKSKEEHRKDEGIRESYSHVEKWLSRILRNNKTIKTRTTKTSRAFRPFAGWNIISWQ